MAHEQLRTSRTGRDVLVGNLRGEVGASITTWVMLRHFIAKANNLRSHDLQQDFGNQELAFVDVLIQKLQDELIAKLAELGDEKIGRTNFYFASRKLCILDNETRAFTKFVETKLFRRKRNQEIAHREQPEKWFDDRPIHIPYKTLMRCLAMAVRLMKRIDRTALGPAAPHLWYEARKRRTEIVAPARAQYLLLPYYRLSPEARVHVVTAEEAEGKVVWSEIRTKVNGVDRSVLVNREWGLLFMGTHCIALPEYPLQHLESINFEQVEHKGT